MVVLSLFDGISICQQALKNCGIPVERYYASEIDKYAIQVTAKNFPDTIQLRDVRGIKGTDLPKIDLLCGGSPCQDLSIAKNKRHGLAGERSGLFWEYARILKEVQPRYFLFENVYSMARYARMTISEALGVEPIAINANLVSAQNRNRLFWTNIPIDMFNAFPKNRGILLRDVLELKDDEPCSQLKSKTLRVGGWGSGYGDKHNFDSIKIGKIGKGGQGQRIYSMEEKSICLSSGGRGSGAKTGLYCVGIIPESIKPKGNFLPRERVFSDKGKFRAVTTSSNQQPYVAVTLRNRGQDKKPEFGGDQAKAMTTVQTEGMVTENLIIRKLTPIECERLQSLPDNFTSGISSAQRYKSLGNGFNCAVIEHILGFMEKETLMSKGRQQ